MVLPVVEHNGEVLKYMGDGLLATFNLEGRPRDSICHDAMEAAYDAYMRVRDLNAARSAKGLPVMELDLALHLGDVLYGNVGADNRLDFTVIGPAVNEASRIEALCDELGRNILISSTFAEAATLCAPHMVPLGRHSLRGIREPQEIYTVDFVEQHCAIPAAS
jgi:adenylate cyclase